MNRWLVVGCPGSGKSYFSRQLAEKTGLPLQPLDLYYHKAGWPLDPDEKRKLWRAKVADLLNEEKWIMDGNYQNTLGIRIPAAEVVVFLDFPISTVLYRLFKRRWEYRNKPRPDMPEGWKEKISPDFLMFVLRYRRDSRPKLVSILDENSSGRTIHIFKSPKDVASFLNAL